MANSVSTTRRAVLKAFPMFGVATVAAGLPAVLDAAPAAETPNERAARLWREFSATMDQVAEGTDGWVIVGAGNRFAHPWVKGGEFLNMRLVSYERRDDPRISDPFYVEQHKQIDIGQPSQRDTY